MSKNSKKKIRQSPEKFDFYAKMLSNDRVSLDSIDFTEKLEELWRENSKTINDPGWPESNLEHDLLTTDWIIAKARDGEVYAQNLYAALCNNDFQKNDVVDILKNKLWSCSWRHAGGIIADMREQGDYGDWYCSGINSDYDEDADKEIENLTEKELYWRNIRKKFVPEGRVTDEIREDLKKLGWLVRDSDK
jgi:hypothetical protein